MMRLTLIAGVLLMMAGCDSLPPVAGDDIREITEALSAAKDTITETGAHSSTAGDVAIKAIEAIEHEAPRWIAKADGVGSVGDLVGAGGGILARLLPPPFGALAGLGTTLLALWQSRKNRQAARAIAHRIEVVRGMNNHVVDFKDKKAKAVLSTMGPRAEKIVAEATDSRVRL